MKNIILALALLLVTACQTKPSAPVTAAPEVHNYILDGSTWLKDLNASGLTVFVEMNTKSVSPQDEALLAGIKIKAVEKLKSLGFIISPKRSQAHVWILFDYKVQEFPQAFPDQNVDTTNGKVSGALSVSETFVLEGKVHQYQVSSQAGPIGDLQMIVYAQDYGQRAQTMSSKRIRGPVGAANFASGIDKVTDSWIQDLENLKTLVKEKKQAGLPGCTPRFGFEIETFWMEGVPYKRVTSVLPKSPAAKAGLKVEDVILAIEGIPYDEFARGNEKSTEIYNSKISVSIKFLRKTQEKTSKIRAQVMCDE
jgi:hypothetical protein